MELWARVKPVQAELGLMASYGRTSAALSVFLILPLQYLPHLACLALHTLLGFVLS